MKKCFFFWCVIISFSTAYAQDLRTTLTQLARQSQGVTGVSLLLLETGDTLSVNGKMQYPMQSTFKFPQALAILHAIEQGKLKLDQKVHVTSADLRKTYSPLRDKYLGSNVDLTIKELMAYSVSLSDNNACDILFRILGGTKPMERYIRSLGIRKMQIRATEAEMATGWNEQFTNWCEPQAMTRLLQQLTERKVLKSLHTDILLKMMTETPTGPDRLKGMLPAGTIVSHKTGTSSTNADGITAATNDVGIITLPNGQHLILSVFVMNSSGSQKLRESTIAEIAKAAYDHYTKN